MSDQETTLDDDFFGEPISTYSREQALADGELVDVTETAKEAGFKIPVALTRAAWADLVEWNRDNTAVQDEHGRLWDCLFLANARARTADGSTPEVEIIISRVPNTGHAHRAEQTTFLMHIGPGDDPSPVITIMLPSDS